MTTYNAPEDLYYTQDHEWLRVEETPDGLIGYVGITDYAQSQLGDIVYVDVSSVDEEVKQFEPFGTIEAVKTVADLFMPASGKILEFNEILREQPQLINEDPYGKGWIIRISISNPEELNQLLSARDYLNLISSE